MTDQLKEIQIQTYRKGGNFRIGDGGARGVQISVNVTEKKHWDPLSKIFKKYTHNIVYELRHRGYQASDYTVTVYGPGVDNKFTYIKPELMVRDVEVYFCANDDTDKSDPLIVGFIIPNWKYNDRSSKVKGCKNSTGSGSKCYYSWTKLKSTSQCDGDITVDSISETDLINGLLEELGTRDKVRQNKLVIRLGEQPEEQSTYPGSGHFTKGDGSSSSNSNRKITVKKESVMDMDVNTVDYTEVEGYVKYVHSFPGIDVGNTGDDDVEGGGAGVSEFYVTYDKNSMYFKTDDGSVDSKIESVDAYFDTSGTFGKNSKKLVLITFALTSGSTYAYSYHDFVNDLKGLKGAKTWSTDVKIISDGRLKTIDLSGYSGLSLKTRLKEESERLRPFIAFKRDDGPDSSGHENQNIKTTGLQNINRKGKGNEKFIKDTMTPNTRDNDVLGVRGSSVGPWTVYSSKLIVHEKGSKIQDLDNVLTGIVTTSSNKYKSITVYYAVTDSEDGNSNKVLLVEFEKADDSGTKIYFKRDKEGTKWVRANENVATSGKVTADVLNQIGIEVNIIKDVSSSVGNVNPGSNGRGGHCGSSSESTTTAQQIHIEIEKRKKGSYTIGGAGVSVKVTPENPWDKLSMLFKKYTHAINYPGSNYKSSQYNISVYSEGSGGSGFTLNTPNPKVDAVELYFRFIDSSNRNPLVVGFVYASSSGSGIRTTSTGHEGNICYYTWAKLANKQYDCAIGADGPISPQDLVTVLLEIGSTVTYKLNKHVLRLDEKPGNGQDVLQYPVSGHIKDRKIRVKKDESKVDGFDKYVHTFSSDAGSENDGGLSEFYVTYEGNSRYFMTPARAKLGPRLRLSSLKVGVEDDKIKSVDAYYKTGTTTVGNNSKNLVLIVFSFKGNVRELYGYKYSDFIKDLREVRSDNIIIENNSKTIRLDSSSKDSELKSILQEESNKLKQITFETANSSSNGGNKHITTQQEDIDDAQGNKFMKVVMQPNKGNDGPWYVYNSKLFTNERGDNIDNNAKIDDSVLTDIATSSSKNKYHSITVYYSLEGRGKYMALLVEFNDYGSKTYIIRLNEGGTKWAITTAASIGIRYTGGPDGYDKELLPILRKQRERFRPLIAFKKGGRGRSSNKHIKTDKPSDLDGKDNVRQRNYKFMKVNLEPDTSDEDRSGGVRGSSSGPWTVYSSKLFNDESGKKIDTDASIDDGVLTGVFTDDVTSSSSNKYKSISVYYAMTASVNRDYKALLVEFVPGRGCGKKKYIKRNDASGREWVDATEFGIGSGIVDTDALVQKLTRTAREVFGEAPGGESGTTTISSDNASSIDSRDADPLGTNGVGISSDTQHPSGPTGSREEAGEPKAASGPGGGGNGRSNGDGSSTDESLVNHSQSTTSSVGSPEDGRGDTISSSSPGGGADGGNSIDDSNTTIGEAVGGGVSLLVASGSTGFGIYRYRHFFLH